jgi:hypothetical protein
MLEEVVIDNTSFFVDKEAMKNYNSIYRNMCDCLTCRNYYKAVQICSPIVKMLDKFYVDVNRPEECMHIGEHFPEKTLYYYVWYSVYGKAVDKKIVTAIDNFTKIEIYPSSQNDHAPNTYMKDNYFWISFNITLPWVLDEDMEQLKPSENLKLTKPSVMQRIVSLFKRK